MISENERTSCGGLTVVISQLVAGVFLFIFVSWVLTDPDGHRVVVEGTLEVAEVIVASGAQTERLMVILTRLAHGREQLESLLELLLIHLFGRLVVLRDFSNLALSHQNLLGL